MLGMKRYAPALTVHEARQRRGSYTERPSRNRHATRRLIRPGVVTENRILVVVEACEARVVAPGLLHELELAPDARVDAEEMNAARVAVVGDLEQGFPAGQVRGIASGRPDRTAAGPKARARRSSRWASDMLRD